jgi:tripartite-type tricarboxylate transporter receptor subunit TctC
LTLVFFTFIAFSLNAYAAYPEEPVKIMVGHSAGGSTDVVARTFAPFLSKYLGAPVVVNNMEGAGGRVMLKYVNTQPADGYTLCMVVTPSYLNVQLMRKPSWDLREFTYFGGVGGGDSNGLIVPYNSKFSTFAEVLEAAKKEPITLAGTSPGSNSWLMAVLLRQYAGGFKFEYVPFNSGKEASMAIVGGHVTMGVASTINFPDLVKEKKIKVLGVASAKRLATLPEAPTFAEMGYPKVNVVTEQVFGGPPKLPAEVIKVLVEAAKKAVNDPEFVSIAEKQGFSVDPMSAQETEQSVMETYTAIQEVLQAAGELK